MESLIESSLFWRFLIYILAGAMGSLVRSIVQYDGTIILPRKVKKRGEPIKFELGIIGSMIVGIVIAIIVDNNINTAFWASIGATEIIEGTYKKLNGDKKLEDN